MAGHNGPLLAVYCFILLCLVVTCPIDAQTVAQKDTFPWNGQQIRFDYISQFSPIYQFHPSEVYTPINLKDLILNSTLYNWIDPTVPIKITDPNILATPRYCCNGTTIGDLTIPGYYLENDPAWVFGAKSCDSSNNLRPKFTTMSNAGPSGRWVRPQGTLTSDNLQQMFSMSTVTYKNVQYAVIAWYLVQGFSAAQTLAVVEDGRARIYLYEGTTLADHAADIQIVYTLLDMDLNMVKYVGLTSHSHEYYRPTAMIDNHPLVYVSLNTHSLYASVDTSNTLATYPRGSFITPYPYQSSDFDYMGYEVTGNGWPPVGGSVPNQTFTGQTCTSHAVNATFACNLFCYVGSSGGYTCEQKPTQGFTGPTNGPISTTVKVVDHWRAGGAIWAPRIQDLYQVGLDQSGASLYAKDNWVKYNGRLGYSSGSLVKANGCENLFCEENKHSECDPDNDGWLTKLWSSGVVCTALYPMGHLDSQGPASLGGRPAIRPVTSGLDSPPGVQSKIQVPREWDSDSPISLNIAWWDSNTNQIKREWYHPNSLTESGQAWEGIQSYKPNMVPVSALDYTVGYGLAVAVYQCSKVRGGPICWSFADDTGHDLGVLSDQGTLSTDPTSMKPKVLLTPCQDSGFNFLCMYYAFVSSSNNQVMIGRELLSGPAGGHYTHVPGSGSVSPAVDSTGAKIYSSKTPGFVTWKNQLVLVYVDDQGYMGWAVAPIDDDPTWARRGLMDANNFITQGSPGVANGAEVFSDETIVISFFSNITSRIMWSYWNTANNTWRTPAAVNSFPIAGLTYATVDVTVTAGYYIWIGARFEGYTVPILGKLPLYKTAIAFGPSFNSLNWIDLGSIDTTTLPALALSQYYPAALSLYPKAPLVSKWPPTPECPSWAKNGYN